MRGSPALPRPHGTAPAAAPASEQPLPRKTLLPFFHEIPAFSTWRRDKTPRREEMDLLNIWRMTEHGSLLTGCCWKRSPCLRHRLRRGFASRSRGQSRLLPHSPVPAGIGNGTRARRGPRDTPAARGARNGRSGQGHAVPVRVTPRGSHPAPCQWQSGCPSPGINPGLCPWENALRCIFLRVGFTPGNCKWQSRPGGCSSCEPHGSAPACAQPRGQLKRGLITV